jgi:hypothetical protein
MGTRPLDRGVPEDRSVRTGGGVSVGGESGLVRGSADGRRYGPGAQDREGGTACRTRLDPAPDPGLVDATTGRRRQCLRPPGQGRRLVDRCLLGRPRGGVPPGVVHRATGDAGVGADMAVPSCPRRTSRARRRARPRHNLRVRRGWQGEERRRTGEDLMYGRRHVLDRTGHGHDVTVGGQDVVDDRDHGPGVHGDAGKACSGNGVGMCRSGGPEQPAGDPDARQDEQPRDHRPYSRMGTRTARDDGGKPPCPRPSRNHAPSLATSLRAGRV